MVSSRYRTQSQFSSHAFLSRGGFVGLGKLEEACTETKIGLPLDLTIECFRLGGPESDNPVFLRQREHPIDMMLKARVSEK
jgi:hypothetical protein